MHGLLFQVRESHATLEALGKMTAQKRRQCFIGTHFDTLEQLQSSSSTDQTNFGTLGAKEGDDGESLGSSSDPGAKMIPPKKKDSLTVQITESVDTPRFVGKIWATIKRSNIHFRTGEAGKNPEKSGKILKNTSVQKISIPLGQDFFSLH